MTLNGVMAIILLYFAEFCSFCGQLCKCPTNVLKYTN